MTYDEYLAHHGILGMRWGKRNGPPYPLTSSQMSSAERKNNKPKPVEEMSDDELNKTLVRLRKEAEYKNLTNSKKDSEAMKYVSRVLATAGGVSIGLLGKRLGKNMAAGIIASKAFLSTFSNEFITNLFFKGKVS